METRCPECQTLFAITPTELQAAGGKVRCGHCFYIFDAAVSGDDIPAEQEQLDISDIDINTFTDDTNVNEFAEEQTEDQVDTDSTETSSSADNSLLFNEHDSLDDLVPAELRASNYDATKKRGKLASTFWSLGILLLLCAGIIQYTYFERARLATNTELRPYLVQACEIARCDIPELRDINRIELSSKNVYSHPNVDKALMITAVIVNQAPFAQRFPELQVSFTNLVGNTIAARQFKPSEYLNTSEESLREMQPGLPVQITLEVQDPGKTATAYEFEFI